MPEKTFTLQEREILRLSPHITTVTKTRIMFTPEFKRVAYTLLMRGRKMRDILQEYSINPDILGEARIMGIAQRIRAMGKREEGFTDLRIKNTHQPAKETPEQTLAARVTQLEHELAYTKQEVEFLKKVHMADLEARMSWKSKHRQK